jgi:hypothetical protein
VVSLIWSGSPSCNSVQCPILGCLVQHGVENSAYQRIVRSTQNPHFNWTFLIFSWSRNRPREDSQAENASSILVARSPTDVQVTVGL